MRGRRLVYERPHRLPRDCYRGMVRVAFTATVDGGRPTFTTSCVYEAFRDQLLEQAQSCACRVLVATFMPEHVQTALEGQTEAADCWAAMVGFKQQSGWWFRRNWAARSWQKGFYDHVLRQEEDLVRHVRYIAENPVRRGLVEDWRAYPFTYVVSDLGL